MYLLVATAPALAVWAAVRYLPVAFRYVEERIMERNRRKRQVPTAPPLESSVANLRRLRRDVRGRPQPTQVRQLALMAAYDRLLVEVCGCVGVDTQLADATGAERDFARLITEAALEDAGIALDPPRGTAAA